MQTHCTGALKDGGRRDGHAPGSRHQHYRHVRDANVHGTGGNQPAELCVHCGAPAPELYCAHCGARQPAMDGPATAQSVDPQNLDPHEMPPSKVSAVPATGLLNRLKRLPRGPVLLIAALLVGAVAWTVVHVTATRSVRGSGNYQSYVALMRHFQNPVATTMSADDFPTKTAPAGEGLCGQPTAQYADDVSMDRSLAKARGWVWRDVVQSQLIVIYVACPDSLDAYQQGLASVLTDASQAQEAVDQVVRADASGSS